MTIFTAVSRVLLDGKIYEPGDDVDLTADQSANLLEEGVVESAGKRSKKPAADSEA